MNNSPIGVLDSGVGGLTVLKELVSLFPNESFIYVGDSGRAPYGPRQVQEIIDFTDQMVDFLIAKGVKMIVLACNTITVTCLEHLQKRYSIPIIGMNFASREVNEASKTRSVAILGTAATIASGRHEAEIRQIGQDLRISSVACFDFAPLVENSHIGDEEAKKGVEKHLAPILGQVDTVLLACTHYPFLAPDIQEFMPDVTLIDPSKFTAEDVKKSLLLHNNLAEKGDGNINLYFSGNLDVIKPLVSMALGENVKVESISWDK